MSNLEANLRSLGSADGFDILIISTSSLRQCAYWRERLANTRKELLPPKTEVHVVHENWPGGAGNGLGTLDALRQIPNLLEHMKQGAAVALYHTAGKGTRLAPLPAAEDNNKSKVKLPGLLAGRTITLLEAVIRQTSLYAPYRKGRVSVFWGDQIFIPETLPNTSTAHVDILCRALPTPNAAQWESGGYSQYGLIIDNAMQVEKVDFETYSSLGKSSLALSLGCFSMSSALTSALLKEFAVDLMKREGQLNSDPHFWMPLTLKKELYERLRPLDGGQYERMARVKAALPTGPLFSGIDIGKDAYWWDFGQLAHYYKNCMKLTEESPEGNALREFFGVKRDSATGCCIVGSPAVYKNAHNSVLVNTRVTDLTVERAVVVDCESPSLKGAGCIAYNLTTHETLCLDENEVIAKVALPNESLLLRTNLQRNGAKDWSVRLPQNRLSFEEVHNNLGA